mmetsp:Transcript_22604/g.27959  ORF Transcript_22604/g.27959 Transcript_22604/m.27959 type:complete len:254 (+) Transcript_22604:225-986(+)
MPIQVAHVRAVVRRTETDTTFRALRGFRRCKHVAANLVVRCSQSECGHFDIGHALSERNCLVILLLVSVAKHSRENMLIEGFKPRPVRFEHTLVEFVVFLTHVFAQLRQKLFAHGGAQRQTNDFLIKSKSVFVEELLTLESAPGCAIKDGSVEVLAGGRLFFDEIEAKDLRAQAATICVEPCFFAGLSLFGQVSVVDMLDERLAVLPRPTVTDLARSQRQAFTAAKDHCAHFESLLACLVKQIQSVEVSSAAA